MIRFVHWHGYIQVLNPYGTCRSCCIAREYITKEDGKIFSLAEHTVSDILNSTYMKKLRKDMRNNIKPNNVAYVGKMKQTVNKAND